MPPPGFAMRRNFTHLRVEPLENRAVPATVTVTGTADTEVPNDHVVTLREAIVSINAGNEQGDTDLKTQHPGTYGVNDVIRFAFPGPGTRRITFTAMPYQIGRSVAIQGPGANLLTIDGGRFGSVF